MSASVQEKRQLPVDIPKKLGFLLKPHRYKVAYGGRGGAKSWSYADALLYKGASRQMRILCAREVQKSIQESVYHTLRIRIESLGLSGFYSLAKNEIRGKNGTAFIFCGLQEHTVESIKSYEGVDVCWVEEAQSVSEQSWRILVPTIRKEGSEIWVSFNPGMESDAVWQRFMVKRPSDCVVQKMLYSDNKWMTEVLERERLDCLRDYPDDYGNIWLGECRTSIAGAVYAREVAAMIEERRYVPVPYDPRLPVHTVWDLGWNDAMSVIMVQKPTPTALNVVNYVEDSFKRFDEYVSDLRELRYNFGVDWLPHDAVNADPKSGKSSVRVLRELGRKVRVMPRTDPEARIRAARMMFPRVYMDSTERRRATGYLGASRLMDCLRRYRRTVPKTTAEPASPVHDQYSHAADAWGGLAEVVDQIRNEGAAPVVRLPEFHNPISSMGLLG